MQATLKLLEIETHRRKTLKKVKENQIMRKIQTATLNIFLVALFLLLHLYYTCCAWQVIGNAVAKHQHSYRYALAL